MPLTITKLQTPKLHSIRLMVNVILNYLLRATLQLRVKRQ